MFSSKLNAFTIKTAYEMQRNYVSLMKTLGIDLSSTMKVWDFENVMKYHFDHYTSKDGIFEGLKNIGGC